MHVSQLKKGEHANEENPNIKYIQYFRDYKAHLKVFSKMDGVPYNAEHHMCAPSSKIC